MGISLISFHFMVLLLYPAATCSNGSSLRPSIIAPIVSGLSIAQEYVREGDGGRDGGHDELNENDDDFYFPSRRGCLILDGGSGPQGKFSFVTVSVILPDSCADAIAGVTSLAILDHVDGRVVVQRVWDDEKPEMEDEKEMAVSCCLQDILGRMSLIRQYCQPGESSETVS